MTIKNREFNQIIRQLQNYGDKNYEEILFVEKENKFSITKTKKPNFLNRNIEWLFKERYEESYVAIRVISFLEANLSHLLNNYIDINYLKKKFVNKITDIKQKEGVEKLFDQLIDDVQRTAEKEKISPQPTIENLSISLKNDKLKLGEFEYDFKKPIAAGVNGEIFVAKDKQSNKDVVIKIAKDVGIEDLKVETFVSSIIGDHPNFIKIIGYDLENSILVMEKADSSINKSSVLKPATTNERMRMIRDLIEGVKYLHSKRLTHNDLSLKNLLIKDGQVKICDLGSCRNYTKGNIVKLKIDDTVQEAINLGIISQTEVRKQTHIEWKDSIRSDIQDTLRVSYNILIGEANDYEIPNNYFEKIKNVCSDLSVKELADLEKIFKDYINGNYNFENLIKLEGILQKHDNKEKHSNNQIFNIINNYISDIENGKHVYLSEDENELQVLEIDKDLMLEKKSLDGNFFKKYINSTELNKDEILQLKKKSILLKNKINHHSSVINRILQFLSGLFNKNNSDENTYFQMKNVLNEINQIKLPVDSLCEDYGESIKINNNRIDIKIRQNLLKENPLLVLNKLGELLSIHKTFPTKIVVNLLDPNGQEIKSSDWGGLSRDFVCTLINEGSKNLIIDKKIINKLTDQNYNQLAAFGFLISYASQSATKVAIGPILEPSFFHSLFKACELLQNNNKDDDIVFELQSYLPEKNQSIENVKSLLCIDIDQLTVNDLIQMNDFVKSYRLNYKENEHWHKNKKGIKISIDKIDIEKLTKKRLEKHKKLIRKTIIDGMNKISELSLPIEPKEIKELLYKNAKEDGQAKAILLIAKMLNADRNYLLNKKNSEIKLVKNENDLMLKIQGNPFSRALLFENLEVRTHGNDGAMVQEWFKKWVNETSEETLLRFVKIATNENSLSGKIKIDLKDSDSEVMFGTCFKLVTISLKTIFQDKKPHAINQEDYLKFKDVLEQSIKMAEIVGYNMK